MTAAEVSRHYHISMDKIRYCEENGLLEHSVLPCGKTEYTEAQTDHPDLTMEVIPIGKVISDLSVFDTLNSTEYTIFTLSE